MRKTIATLMALLVLTFVAACGASGDDDSAGDTTTTEATSTTEATETTEAETTTSEATTTTEATNPDAVAVEEWADGFCGNFETWIANIKTAGENVGTGIQGGDVEAGKAAIVELFATASAETDTLITSIEDGGFPDIDQGDELVDDLIGKFNDFNEAITAARGEAEALPTDDPEAFGAEVEGLVTAFDEETTTVGNSFAELDADYPSPELSSALSSSCESF